MRGETLIYKIFRPKIIRILAFFARTNGRKRKEERKEGGREKNKSCEKKPTIEPYTQMEAKISATRVRGQKKNCYLHQRKRGKGKSHWTGAEGGVSY